MGESLTMAKTEFSDDELLRYSRHILLPQVDITGQLALANGRVLVAGLGGLGSPVAQYLAASGVGHLTFADFDEVDSSNLQRQVIHSGQRLGQNKAVSAAQSVRALNEFIQVDVVSEALSEENLMDLVAQMDIVVDCTDNFLSRKAINLACVRQRVPLVSGAAIGFEGQVCVFNPKKSDSPCYQCLFPELDDQQLSCSQSGVFAPLVGIIGSMQAMETLKLLACCGEPNHGKLHIYSGLNSCWRTFNVKRDSHCPSCKGS